MPVRDYTPIIYEPIQHPLTQEANSYGYTVEEYLKLLEAQNNQKAVIYTTGEDPTKYRPEADKQSVDIARQIKAEGEQKQKQEAAKAAEAIMGMGLPSTYVNTGLEWSGRQFLSQDASAALDLGLPLGIGAMKIAAPIIKMGVKNAPRVITFNTQLKQGIKDFKGNGQASTGRIIQYVEPQQRVFPRTSFKFFERDNNLTYAERFGLPKQERAVLGNFQTELDWRPISWMRTNIPDTKGRPYSAYDAMTLQSHVPEYLQIEKNLRNAGSYNPPAHLDARTYIQLQSKNAQYLDKNPIFTGIRVPNGASPEYNGIFWGTRANGKIGLGNISPYQARSYSFDDKYTLQLSVPNDTKTFGFNAGGNSWYRLSGDKTTNNIVSKYFSNGFDRVNIDNVIDPGPESGLLRNKTKYKIFDNFIDERQIMPRIPQNDVIINQYVPRKSIIGNNGNFNIDDPNIYRKEGGKINYLNYLGTTYKIDISAENVSKWAGGAVATRLSPFKQDSSKIYEQYLSFDPYENDLSLYIPNPQDSTEGEQEKVKVEQEKVEVPAKTTATKPGSWKEFRDTLIAALQKKGFTGEAAQTLVAQMGLETGHGKHMSGDYNYGNITAGKNWSGKTVQKVDNYSGKTYSFRSYDDLDQAMNDYVNLLTRSYGVTPQDTKDQIYAKLTGGNQRGRKWAEAQNYTQNIDSVYNMYWK